MDGALTSFLYLKTGEASTSLSHQAIPFVAHFGASTRGNNSAQFVSTLLRAGPGTLRPQAKRLPGLHISRKVKDLSPRLAIEASRKIQERSRELVHESTILIATAIQLIDEARLGSAQRKARKSSSVAMRR